MINFYLTYLGNHYIIWTSNPEFYCRKHLHSQQCYKSVVFHRWFSPNQISPKANLQITKECFSFCLKTSSPNDENVLAKPCIVDLDTHVWTAVLKYPFLLSINDL